MLAHFEFFVLVIRGILELILAHFGFEKILIVFSRTRCCVLNQMCSTTNVSY